ncbi:MAG: DUF4124 domain-containing protein [Halothiobacillaceae bacterium]
MRHIFATLVCFIAFASSPLRAETTIYKWVDSKGITHFGAQPPQNVKSVEVEPRVYAPATPAPSNTNEAKPEDKPAEAAAEKPKEMLTISAEEIAKQCKDAQARLQQLEASPRLMTRSADGQMQRVPEEERQKMIETERANVADYCQ